MFCAVPRTTLGSSDVLAAATAAGSRTRIFQVNKARRRYQPEPFSGTILPLLGDF